MTLPEPNTPEWLELRRKYMGASDAPVALGLSYYKSMRSLALEKKGQTDFEPETPQQHRGHVLELPVLLAYAKRFDLKLDPSRFVVHPDIGFMSATPDAFIHGAEKHVQVKTCNNWTRGEWGAQGTDSMPQFYYVQVLHELAVLQDEGVDVVVLFADEPVFDLLVWMIDNGVPAEKVADRILQMDLQVFPVHRDLDVEMSLVEAEKDFWDRYVLGDEIPPDYKSAKDDGSIVMAVDEELETLVRAKKAWIAQEIAKRELTELQGTIQDMIGESSGLRLSPTEVVTWKRTKDTIKTDWEKLARSLNPDIKKIAEFTNAKEGSRTFRWPRVWKTEVPVKEGE